MLINSKDMEMQAVMACAAQVCAAARTAPKAKGVDLVETLVLTGEDKDALADAMARLAGTLGADFFVRDADNLRAAQAVVLIGIREGRRGLGEMCGYCHFDGCDGCAAQGGACAMDAVDVGIAIGSAAAAAADRRVDTRVMFSIGRAAREAGLMGAGVGMIFGLPLSVSGKSPFFDRKKK